MNGNFIKFENFDIIGNFLELEEFKNLVNFSKIRKSWQTLKFY